MHRYLRPVIGLAILAAACGDETETSFQPSADAVESGGAVRVTTSADAGAGSLREAVQRANADPSIGVIRFAGGLDRVRLRETVTYSGPQALILQGHGVRLDGSGLPSGSSALVADGGSNLTIRELTVVDVPGNGVTVKVPGTASGLVEIRLDQVTVLRSGLHGILINDQAEYFADPLSTSDAGSPASLLVVVSDSRFERNGFALIDSDGLRINEGGSGTLEARVRSTRFANNGADGLELDERAAGDVAFAVRHTVLVGNGSFASEDLDDGIDVDESGDGDLVGRFDDVEANRNFEQGVDLNENGAGDLRVVMADVRAAENNEEGIEFEEDDDVAGGGGIEATLERIVTRANGSAGGDAGLKLREKGEGDLSARLVGVLSLNNRMATDEDPVSGILIREDEGGSLTARLVGANARGNGGHGIELEENEDGNLSGHIGDSRASDNDGAGASVVQAVPGTGSIEVTSFTGSGNAEGRVVADGVAMTGSP